MQVVGKTFPKEEKPENKRKPAVKKVKKETKETVTEVK